MANPTPPRTIAFRLGSRIAAQAQQRMSQAQPRPPRPLRGDQRGNAAPASEPNPGQPPGLDCPRTPLLKALPLEPRSRYIPRSDGAWPRPRQPVQGDLKSRHGSRCDDDRQCGIVLHESPLLLKRNGLARSQLPVIRGGWSTLKTVRSCWVPQPFGV